ncbi:MAG: enolase C-terminal domain-like protein [Balneolales bacterium]
MKIVEIRHATKPLHSEISNAFIDFSEMTTSTVAVISDQIRNGKPVVGFGFCSNGRYAQRGIIEDRLIPRLQNAKDEDLLNEEENNVDPHRCWDIMMKNEKPGGHGERSVAVGTIDMALWDLASKIEDVPLYKYLSDRYSDGLANPRIYVYAAGGYYYPHKGIDNLKTEVLGYLDMGYDTVKIKIGGAGLAEDLKRVEAVINVTGNGNKVAVDANGRFDLLKALEYNRALEVLNLKWFEEAGDPLDYMLQATLGELSDLPMATGENIFSMTDTRNLLRYAGLNPQRDFLQIDPVLSYGVVEYLRILDLLHNQGWSPYRCIPHGGHQITLHIAAAFGLFGNESYPGIFQPFGGFHDSAKVQDGYVMIPDAPGIGFELKNKLYGLFQSLI